MSTWALSGNRSSGLELSWGLKLASEDRKLRLRLFCSSPLSLTFVEVTALFFQVEETKARMIT